MLVLTKHFARPEELAAEYGAPADSNGLQVEVEVVKSFRWFYTFYRYREVFHRLTPFTEGSPPRQCFLRRRCARYAQGERNSLLNQKAEFWVARSLYEILVDTLTAGLLAADDRLGAAILEEKKEPLFEALVKKSVPTAPSGISAKRSLNGSRIEGMPARSSSGSKITEAGLAAFVELVGMVVGIPPGPGAGRKRTRRVARVEQRGRTVSATCRGSLWLR